MAKTYTTNFKEKVSNTQGEEPIYLIELNHPQLAVTVRVANDTQDFVSNGETFIACAFRIQFPDDVAQVMPRVPISIDNIGRELTQWLEGSSGGKGATVRIMQVMRDAPDIIEQEYTMTLLGVRQNMMEITGELGYENLLDLPALAATYTPENTPGIF